MIFKWDLAFSCIPGQETNLLHFFLATVSSSVSAQSVIITLLQVRRKVTKTFVLSNCEGSSSEQRDPTEPFT